MDSYYNKYLKYKEKLHNLKMNQYGGNQIFDLDNDDLITKKDVQQNLKLLVKTYGNNFYIKHNEITVPVRLHKIKTISNGLIFFELHMQLDKRTHIQPPFSIQFIDIKTNELNNNTYIQFIHNTKQFTGSQMVNLCLDIQRKLGVDKTRIHDATSIKCVENNQELNLSFFKLIEKKQTYYMRFGFDVEILGCFGSEIPFTSKESWHNTVTDLHNQIKKIKINDIIHKFQHVLTVIEDVIIRKNYDEFMIKYLTMPNFMPYDYYLEANVESKIIDLKKNLPTVINILSNTKLIYLQELLIDLFNNRCKDYSVLNQYILKSQILAITYLNSDIYFEYVPLFRQLNAIAAMTYYSYNFN